MNLLQKTVFFRNLIDTELEQIFLDHNYKLIFNNNLENQDESENWVFKRIYKGKSVIEISSDDWRDYIEYFDVLVNDKKVFCVNLLDFQNLEEAFEFLKTRILQII